MANDKPEVLRGHEAYKARLAAGENVTRRETGNSMVPKIHSREEIEYKPVTCPDDVNEGDVVWCKVKGNHFTHLVKAKKLEGDAWRFQIGNNKGRHQRLDRLRERLRQGDFGGREAAIRVERCPESAT